MDTELTTEQIESLTAKIQKLEENDSPTPPIFYEDEIPAIQDEMKKLKPMPIKKDEYAVLDTDFGVIILEFFPDVAPIHCGSFKKLSTSGFYDWVSWHRVVPGFVIQSGSISSKTENPNDDGSGSPGYTLKAEFSDLSHKRGTLSMARIGHDNDSAGSQFFICLKPTPYLNGDYTVFGRVIHGMEVVDEIADVKRGSGDRPVEKIYIKRARVLKP